MSCASYLSRTSVHTCIYLHSPYSHTHKITHKSMQSCSSLYRIIFSNYKKSLKGQEIIYKQYVVSDNLYIFGPLQTSKNRERYKEGQYPENMEKLTISNAGKITAEVSFFFRDDPNGTTYLLDPATMTLDSGQSQVKYMWYQWG